MKLIDEVRRQLDSDVLEYGWLLSIAKSDCNLPPQAAIAAVVSCVVELLRRNEIVVGDALLQDEMVVIKPWTSSSSSVEKRLRASAMEIGGRPEPGEGFWIQKREYFDLPEVSTP